MFVIHKYLHVVLQIWAYYMGAQIQINVDFRNPDQLRRV